MRREGAEALVRVRDSGIGIAPEDLTRVFEPFVQIGQPHGRGPGGLGVGLSLARRLTEMHGGRIEVSSAGPGQGSEFVIRLPTLAGEPPATDSAGETETSRHVRRRILVVDDNADSRDSLALALTVAGHIVREAEDGPKALVEAAEFRPEVAVLDIGLPGMDGYELARRLRSQSAPRGIMLIALTGWGQEEDRQRGREAGFDTYMVKPASPDAILAALRHLGSRPSAGRGAADGN